jgi:hypothetical protein
MRAEKYHAHTLEGLLKRRKVATLAELKGALKAPGHMTVFRKLTALGYRTSYSHRGKYYTLASIPRFDAQGLWSYRDIRFSRFGTLIATAEAFVSQSEGGYFVRELDGILHVQTKKALQQLFNEQKLWREKVSGWYLYCAVEAVKRKEQLRARKILESELLLGQGLTGRQVSIDELKAATLLVYSLLDEKQLRLSAGLESLKWGYGGDRKVADLLGLNVHTVARGRKELLEGEIDRDRLRKPGGGRPSTKKNTGGRR